MGRPGRVTGTRELAISDTPYIVPESGWTARDISWAAEMAQASLSVPSCDAVSA